MTKVLHFEIAWKLPQICAVESPILRTLDHLQDFVQRVAFLLLSSDVFGVLPLDKFLNQQWVSSEVPYPDYPGASYGVSEKIGLLLQGGAP